MSTPKTIQIFLPTGDPRGIRIAELTTGIVQVIEVPRSLLQDFLKMDESGQVAVYFLFGEADDGSGPRIYIGQTGDLRARLSKHNEEKDFWQRAFVLISRTNNLTGTHGLYLEWHALQAARKAARYKDDNKNAGTKPHALAPMLHDCLAIFEMGSVLLASLGFPVFDPMAKPVAAVGPDEVFHCTVSGIVGKMLYTSEGFVVLKGSVGRKENTPTFSAPNTAFRKQLLDTGVLTEDGTNVVFTKDHLFNSPSMAALALLGRTSNGWKEWKSKDGKTLDELKRAPLVGAL